MERRDKRELIKEVIRVLIEKPLSINEISKKIDANWSTVDNVLKLLEEAGRVKEEVEETGRGKTRIYHLSESVPREKDTWFGIPISEEERNLCYFIFDNIKNFWVEKNKIAPGKTAVQKVLVDVAHKCNLPISYGWYKFGKIALLIYDGEEDYKVERIPENAEKIKKEVILISTEYMKLKFSDLMRRRQYEKYDNKLYLTGYELNDILTRCDDLNKKVTTIQKLTSDLLYYMPVEEEAKKVNSLVDKFVLSLNKILLSRMNLDNEIVKRTITEAYSNLWEIIALYCFIKSLKENEQVRKNIKEGKLQLYFDDSVIFAELNAKESIALLEELYQVPKDLRKLTISKEAKVIRDSLVGMLRDE